MKNKNDILREKYRKGRKVSILNFATLRVLIVDDNIFKTMKIRNVLMENGISTIIMVDNQQDAWNEIVGKSVDLVVTDMHYPLSMFGIPDERAGFKLIERMKKSNIQIPVIICSTRNYESADVFGSVWYNEIVDMNQAFRNILGKLKNYC